MVLRIRQHRPNKAELLAGLNSGPQLSLCRVYPSNQLCLQDVLSLSQSSIHPLPTAKGRPRDQACTPLFCTFWPEMGTPLADKCPGADDASGPAGTSVCHAPPSLPPKPPPPTPPNKRAFHLEPRRRSDTVSYHNHGSKVWALLPAASLTASYANVLCATYPPTHPPATFSLPGSRGILHASGSLRCSGYPSRSRPKLEITPFLICSRLLKVHVELQHTLPQGPVCPTPGSTCRLWLGDGGVLRKLRGISALLRVGCCLLEEAKLATRARARTHSS